MLANLVHHPQSEGMSKTLHPAPPARSRRTSAQARRASRAARLQASASPYAGTCPPMGVVSALSDATPRNSHMRPTVNALAGEFRTRKPLWNVKGVRIG